MKSLRLLFICLILSSTLFASAAAKPEKIKFSPRRGLHDAPFDLRITSDATAVKIFFTTNGALPAPNSGQLFSNSIRISTTTMIRAAGLRPAHSRRLNRRPEESPKHAFRLAFHKKYGAGKLKFPLFPGPGAEEFDGLILRAGSQSDGRLFSGCVTARGWARWHKLQAPRSPVHRWADRCCGERNVRSNRTSCCVPPHVQ